MVTGMSRISNALAPSRGEGGDLEETHSGHMPGCRLQPQAGKGSQGCSTSRCPAPNLHPNLPSSNGCEINSRPSGHKNRKHLPGLSRWGLRRGAGRGTAPGSGFCWELASTGPSTQMAKILLQLTAAMWNVGPRWQGHLISQKARVQIFIRDPLVGKKLSN